MSHKKYKKIRKEIRSIGFDPTKGAGLIMYRNAKKRYGELNKFERENV